MMMMVAAAWVMVTGGGDVIISTDVDTCFGGVDGGDDDVGIQYG